MSFDRNSDLANNPTPRIAVCLCLDTSGSMEGESIAELNDGVEMFYKAINEDLQASRAAEICIISFGANGVSVEQDFSSISVAPNPPVLKSGGLTPIGEAVDVALRKLEECKNEYKNNGIEYYQPWLVLMSDGYPTDDITGPAQRCAQTVKDRKLTIFPIAIGEGADIEGLNAFSPNRSPMRLKGLNFREFFTWLSKSVSTVSRSQPGDKVSLSKDTIDEWAEL